MLLNENASFKNNRDYLKRLSQKAASANTKKQLYPIINEVADADRYLHNQLLKENSEQIDSEIISIKMLFDTALNNFSYKVPGKNSLPKEERHYSLSSENSEFTTLFACVVVSVLLFILFIFSICTDSIVGMILALVLTEVVMYWAFKKSVCKIKEQPELYFLDSYSRINRARYWTSLLKKCNCMAATDLEAFNISKDFIESTCVNLNDRDVVKHFEYIEYLHDKYLTTV